MLQTLGLNEPGGIVYQAILTGPPDSVSGLAARTGLRAAQVQAALAALAALRLVRARAPERWEPVNPQSGLATIARRHEADLPQQPHKIAAAYTAAIAAYSGACPACSQIERLEEPGEVHAQAETLARSARAELQVTISELPAISPENGASWLAQLGVAPGVTVKALYHDSICRGPVAITQVARLAQPGSQARMTRDLPPVLVISDKQAA
jgi:hypothetical protein